MKTSRQTVRSTAALAFSGIVLSAAVSAAPINRGPGQLSLKACNVNDVQVTKVANQGTGEIFDLSSAPIAASACMGTARGNDKIGVSKNNLGWLGDGWLNDTSVFGPYGAFLLEKDLQDLKLPGNPVDPGWIFVGKTDYTKDFGIEKFTAGTVSDGEQSYTFSSDLLQVNKDGTFTYKPPATNPLALMDILGANKFFDQLAIVFKAADYHAIYNFTLASFDGLLKLAVGTKDPNYAFHGTWDMSKTLINNGGRPAGLSHVSVWLRDPAFVTPFITTEVALPATLPLFALGLLGLGVLRRRR
jgi:hypothetical protein